MAYDLRHLGLYEGMTVIVHSSLSSVGWVCGGPVAVIQALMDVVTDKGTIIMPAHTGGYSDPCDWRNPPVPQEWWPIIRDTMPAFEPKITPTSFMGIIAETFRSFDGVIRSSHPSVSFSAWGDHAEFITGNHLIDYSLGETSPLARVYDLDGWVLLLGADYGSNTSFHLSEYRVPGQQVCKSGAPIIENGIRVWRTYEDIEFNTELFEAIGEEFEKDCSIIKELVGSAESRLFKQRLCVDYAKDWITKKRMELIVNE